MEIYTGNVQKVSVKVPFTATQADVTVVDDSGVLLHDFATVSKEAAGYSVTLPFFLVSNDRKFTINWTLRYEELGPRVYTNSVPVSVVTPYADIEEIRDALGPEEINFTDAQLAQAERRIRGIVNKYTNQEFGKSVETIKVVGAGDNQLRLPKRLVSINTLGGAGVLPNPDFYAIRGDGWYLGYSTTPPLTDVIYTNPIHDPDSVWANGGFKENFVYTVSGTWGYESVPTEVKEATLVLIEDALCPDSEYRDRYLDNVRAADWRVEYSDRAFRGTGSVMADQLLDGYRRWSMTVI